MTFSMAADGYSMMETPAWSNSWYPYRHNPVPYLVPQFSESFTGESIGNCPDRMYHQPIQQSGMRSSVIGPSRSPFNEHTEPEANKGPLSQLQELANVFSSPAPCNRNQDNDVKVRYYNFYTSVYSLKMRKIGRYEELVFLANYRRRNSGQTLILERGVFDTDIWIKSLTRGFGDRGLSKQLAPRSGHFS